MPQLDILAWVVAAVSAVMVGVSKTGIPGVSIMIVPLMAAAMPAGRSVGALLGMLILADIFAITYHRRNAVWSHVVRLLPAAFGGVVAGYYLLRAMRDGGGEIQDAYLKPVIGIIVLAMLGVNLWRRRDERAAEHVPQRWWFAATMGVMAGLTTMLGNAAGPVVVLYLLAMRLPKVEFVGTSAWFFFIINWIKVPFTSRLDMMTAETIKLDVLMLPFIGLGSLLGIYFLRRIPQKAFNAVAEILAAVAALNLIIPSVVRMVGG